MDRKVTSNVLTINGSTQLVEKLYNDVQSETQLLSFNSLIPIESYCTEECYILDDSDDEEQLPVNMWGSETDAVLIDVTNVTNVTDTTVTELVYYFDTVGVPLNWLLTLMEKYNLNFDYTCSGYQQSELCSTDPVHIFKKIDEKVVIEHETADVGNTIIETSEQELEMDV